MVIEVGNELKVIMVAPRNIGKTSLLAAMHEEFPKTFERANLQTWTTDTNTMRAIEECKKVLRNVDCRLKKQVIRTNPEDNPQRVKGFIFEIGSTGKKFMKLDFTDPSGEYFTPDNYKLTEVQKNYVAEKLNECDAIVIPIDSTALMETKRGRVKDQEVGAWHEDKNAPSHITQLLKDAFSSGNITSPRLIILAPVKSESYVRNGQEAEKLLEHVKLGYSALLDFLKSDDLIDKVSVVVTPVQTIGSIAFAYHKENQDTGVIQFFYHKTPINAPYAPKDGDQPLRYILLFLINIYLAEKRKILDEEREKFELLNKELDIKSKEYERAKFEYEERKIRLEKRNRVWWGFRHVANLFDDRKTDFEIAQSQVNRSNEQKAQVEEEVISAKITIGATEEQINTFSNALFKFAIGCKNTDGFAILQGHKYLDIPQSLF
ncbi:TRAFAC clade GTPase domain-containing protein [Synechocystis sp. CACIAM 05]|uniref:TRAFAC clade GTPase domain-containing protein n=1 Tax=Synechocystis sp. CACIAM 05 TaxID=1933929 RepID=UPI00138E8DC1|nr:hypothetical protein [Synechocystis sp. CACIAM 05]QHV01328.1 hypothetical protein BWK47_15105 [Synechocystis sp. CACIAM 05]